MPFDSLDSTYEVSNPVATCLREARAHIIAHGWCQNTLRNHKNQICLRGALIRAADFEENTLTLIDTRWNDTTMAADNLLTKIVGSAVPVWNNAPGRTEAEVIYALDKAIALAEAESQKV